MRILVGCESSQEVCKAFRALGHEAYSCDLLPALGGHPEWHFQEDIFAVLARERFDMLICFPPCTYLTVSAARWLIDQPERASGVLVGAARREAQQQALDFVRRLMRANVLLKCFENPVGAISTQIMPPTQIIQPWQFGHPEQKTTCLWLQGLPRLKPTHIVHAEMMLLPRKERERIHYMSSSADRWQERSVTYSGVAQAMAAQWSNIVPKPNTWFQSNLF